MKIQTASYIIEGCVPRKETREVPEITLKENTINTLSCSIYYDKRGKIMIELFDDRVEITNPGRLVSTVLPDNLEPKAQAETLWFLFI